jgi:hypothetical protein
MAILSKGYTFQTTEQVTAAKLHSLVDSATFVSGAVVAGGGLSVSNGGASLFISDLGVTEAKLAASSVSTTKIQDATVTPAKLSTYAPTWTSTTTSIANSLDFASISSSTTGTYSRTGYTITVNMTAHGMSDGTIVTLDFTSGAGSDGSYIISGVSANQFTVTDAQTGSTSGNCTRTSYYGNSRVRGSQTIDGNLSVGKDVSVTGSLSLSGSTVRLLTNGTAVSASGSSVEFTSLPSWVRRITIMLAGVSTVGSTKVLIQLGTSAGYTTSGYLSTVSWGSGSNDTDTTGFIVGGTAGADARSGLCFVCLLGSNSWSYSGNVKVSTTNVMSSGGDVTLSAVCDRIRITTSGTFDAGTINIMYE